MAQATNITLFDGAVAPVSHLFQHRKTITGQGGSVETHWAEQIPTVAEAGQIRLFQSITSNRGSGMHRMATGVQFPVLEAIATGGTSQGYLAAPKPAHTVQHALISNVSSRATELESRIAFMLLLNWLSNRYVTTPAVDAGFAADLHQRRLIAT